MKKFLILFFSVLLMSSVGLLFLQVGSKDVQAISALKKNQPEEIKLTNKGFETIDVALEKREIRIDLDVEKKNNTAQGEIEIDLPKGFSSISNKKNQVDFIKNENRVVIKFEKSENHWTVPIILNGAIFQNEEVELHARMITPETIIQSNDFKINVEDVNRNENENVGSNINELQREQAVKIPINNGAMTAESAVPNLEKTGVNPQIQGRNLQTFALRSNNGMTTKAGVPNAEKPAVITSAKGINERNVSNWSDFEAAMTNQSINVIHVQADFYNTRTTNEETNVSTPKRNLTIKGNGHIIDFRGIGFRNTTSVLANETIRWTVENLTMYGRNYYGPVHTSSSVSLNNGYGALVYKDVTYIGAQLTASYAWTIEFAGSIENHSEYDSYTSPFDKVIYSTEGRKGEANIEAKDVIFKENSTYNGEAYAAVFILRQSGSMILEDNAKVTMTSKGRSGEEGIYALYLQGIVKTGKNAELTINGQESGNQYGIYISGSGNGLYASNNSKIKLRTYGGEKQSILMQSYTSIIIEDGAELDVSSINRGSSTANVVQAEHYTRFIIGKKGIFNVTSDGYGNHNLLKFGLTALFQFADAKKVNLQFTNNALNTGARVIYMDGSNGVLEVDVQDVQAWNRMNITTNGSRQADYQWTPMFGMKTSFSGGTGTVRSASSITNSERVRYTNEFKPQNFSRLLYSYIADVEVGILNPLTDNRASEDSSVVKGTTNPGAYVRLTGDPALPIPKVPSIITGANEKELTDPFTVIADANGNFEVNAKAGQHFTAANNINAFSFLGGKSGSTTVKVLDGTAPTGEGVNLVILLGDDLPNPKKFVMNPRDTNPTNKGFTYKFKEDYSALRNEEGIHDIIILLADDAGNKTEIPVKLDVRKNGYAIKVDDVVVLLSKLRTYNTETKMKAFLLQESKATAHGIINNTNIDLTQYLVFDDLANINQMKAGQYDIKLSFNVGAQQPDAKANNVFTVTVLNDEAVKPTKPDNPGSGDPEEVENGGTGQNGLLKLDYAPSKFDFGEVKFGFDNVSANAIKTTSSKQWLQVSDNRLDKNMTNWSVQVVQNHTLKNKSGDEMQGALITIPKGKVYNELTGDQEVTTGQLIPRTVTITTTPTVIFSANNKVNRSNDISTNVWNAADVVLNIPGGQVVKHEEYTNTITWSLVAEP